MTAVSDRESRSLTERITARLRPRLRYLAPGVVVIVVLAGGGFAALETDTVSSFGDGVWWALSLVTTVGFIGESPTTTAGKLLAGLLMIVGFGLLSLVTAAVASLFVREDGAPFERRETAFEVSVMHELHALNQRLDHLERRFPSDGDGDPARVS